MSSKKQVRKQRREREQEERERTGRNPAVLFLVGITMAIAVTVGGWMLFGGSSGPGDPPFPGAVWSPAHDHWH